MEEKGIGHSAGARSLPLADDHIYAGVELLLEAPLAPAVGFTRSCFEPPVVFAPDASASQCPFRTPRKIQSFRGVFYLIVGWRGVVSGQSSVLADTFSGTFSG